MIEAGIKNLLTVTNAVASLITGTSGPRVYPVRIPEGGDRPCVVYSLIGLEFTDGLDDEDNDTLETEAEQNGPETARFRLECWGEGEEGYKQACTLALAVRNLFRKQKGRMGVNSTLKTKFSMVEDVRDEEFDQEDGMDSKRFLRVVDIAVEYDPAQV